MWQGDEDQVVPPNQAVIMHKALAERGLPTALVMFKGEQHGFRKAPNMRAALDGELYFYGKVWLCSCYVLVSIRSTLMCVYIGC